MYVKLRIFFGDFPQSREKGFRRGLAAVAFDEFFAPGQRHFGQAVGVILSAVVLPELHVGQRVVLVFVGEAQRSAVLVDGHHGAGREVDAEADDFVSGVVHRQLLAAGQRRIHHGVSVGLFAEAQLRFAGFHINQNGAGR